MAEIQLTNIGYVTPTLTNQYVTVEYKVFEDPDSSYIMFNDNALVLPDGTFSPAILITDLLNWTNYSVRISMKCNTSSFVRTFRFTTTTTLPLVVYWGWKSDNTLLSDSAIIASPNSQIVTVIQDITCSFDGGSASPQFLWMAEPLDCFQKTKWQDTVQILNNGNIGTDQDLFGPIQTSGNFRFYITEYVTQQSNPIKFEVS